VLETPKVSWESSAGHLETTLSILLACLVWTFRCLVACRRKCYGRDIRFLMLIEDQPCRHLPLLNGEEVRVVSMS